MAPASRGAPVTAQRGIWARLASQYGTPRVAATTVVAPVVAAEQAAASKPRRAPSARRSGPLRAVIYTGGNDVAPAAAQVEQCSALCDRLGYLVVALAGDAPGGSEAWEAAQQMVRDGTADRVVYAGPVHLPLFLESVSSSWVASRPAEQRPEPVRRGERRIEPVRRAAEGLAPSTEVASTSVPEQRPAQRRPQPLRRDEGR